MWKELVAQKTEWIGGEILDYGDSMDRRVAEPGSIPMKTKIVDIVLTLDSFDVIGKDFTCSGDLKFLGFACSPEFPVVEDELAFSGYGGHEWHIKKKVKNGNKKF